MPDEDITLTRVEVVGSLATGRAEASLVWADVLGTAWLNARPIARYLAFMFVAGVIACYGVIDNNAILIVGAMAVSPDLLPITAIAVGIVGRARPRRPRFVTLALGPGDRERRGGGISYGQIGSTSSRRASTSRRPGCWAASRAVNDETIAVALVAGVAGMLALETRASSGVGVAISVTTIPAAAYLGVAAGLGELETATGALGGARRERRDDGGRRRRHARAPAPRSRTTAEARDDAPSASPPPSRGGRAHGAGPDRRAVADRPE